MNFAAVVGRLRRRMPDGKADALLAAAAIIALALHVWFEGGRWRMLPAYALAGAVFASAARAWRGKVLGAVLALAFVVAAAVAAIP